MISPEPSITGPLSALTRFSPPSRFWHSDCLELLHHVEEKSKPLFLQDQGEVTMKLAALAILILALAVVRTPAGAAVA